MLAPVLALAAGAARWFMQGSDNVFTATSRRYYVPDPDLGWRVVDHGPIWLGLDFLILCAALGLAVAAAAWLVRRRERRQKQSSLMARVLLWLVAALPLAVPVAAFTSGLGPDDARDTLPLTAHHDSVAPDGINGAIKSAPAGRYHVLAHEGSAITARLQAGGEAFDTRFTGNISGHITFNPADLAQLAQVWVRVDAASVDTGITMRSKHAREYLKVEKHPEIGFKLSRLLAARQGTSSSHIEFWARGQIALMGRSQDVTVTGSVQAPDAQGRQRLGVEGDVLVVNADLALDLEQTALAGDAGDFDATQIPVHVSLVLARGAAGNEKPH